jgi:hypothetical protein
MSKEEFDGLMEKVESGEITREEVFRSLGLNAKRNSHLLVASFEGFRIGIYLLALLSSAVRTEEDGRLTKELSEMSFEEWHRPFTI